MDTYDVSDDDFLTVSTLIFLDLETTGLIKKSEPLPRVTELALVAISRDNFLNCKNGMPRVMHKLILPFNTNMDIPNIVQNMTKLTSNILGNEKEFDNDAYIAIKHFLNRLKQPICFVSHNGNKFDFPLLINEFKLIKQDYMDELPPNLLCLDTLNGFKDIFKNFKMDTSNDSDKILSNQSPKVCKLNDHTYPKTYSSANTYTFVGNGVHVDTKPSSPMKIIENYKLPTIFKYLHGYQADQAHSAEGDCLTLIKCCLKIKDKFMYWADLNVGLLKKYELTCDV